MSEYIYLVGAEDVSRAASTMQSAAQDMCRAAGNIEEAVRQQKVNNDDCLAQLRDILERDANVRRILEGKVG